MPWRPGRIAYARKCVSLQPTISGLPHPLRAPSARRCCPRTARPNIPCSTTATMAIKEDVMPKKEADTNKALHLRRLDHMYANHPGAAWTTVEIAERLGCTRRTALRYLTEMSATGQL